MLEFENLGGHGLAQCEDGAAAEVAEVDALAHFFAHFVVVVDFLCLAQGDLGVFVGHFAVGHDGAVVVDFEVSLFGVYDQVVTVLVAVGLLQYAAEGVFDDADEGCLVNVLGLLEVFEGVNQVDAFLCFLDSHCYVECLMIVCLLVI